MTERERETLLAAFCGEFEYAALAGRCRTQNEFNRLIVDLENILAPGEIARIPHLRLASPASERTKVWVNTQSLAAGRVCGASKL